jgi:hypothetical protein
MVHSFFIHNRRDEFRRDLRHDCVAVTAQSHHAGWYPISQREKCGFSRYAARFSVAALDNGGIAARRSAMRKCQQFLQPSLTGVQRMASGFQVWVRYSMGVFCI